MKLDLMKSQKLYVRLLYCKQYNELLLQKNIHNAAGETMKHEETCFYTLKVCIDYKRFPKHKNKCCKMTAVKQTSTELALSALLDLYISKNFNYFITK